MIPDFQTIMLPLILSFNNEEVLTSKELRNRMIKHFNINEDEQKQTTPSGKQLLYYNRIAWAITYLKMAELIESVERGHYKLSSFGAEIQKNPPEKINIAFLKKFPNFERNRNPGKSDIENKGTIDKNSVDNQEDEQVTPDEMIEIGISRINNELSAELLKSINNCSPYFFEKLVVGLLLKMGYGGYEDNIEAVTSKSNDEGIDGIIKEDKLGFGKIYIQAKKWENTVSRPEIQKFVGALHGKKAKKGVFITTSNFSKEAVEYVGHLDQAVILVDGKKLTQLMIENELAVTVKNIYKVSQIDTDYFSDDL